MNLAESRMIKTVNEENTREGDSRLFQALKELCPISWGHATHLFSIESNDYSTVIYLHVFKPLRVKYPQLRAHRCIPMREEI